MNWVTNHLDVAIWITAFILVTAGYWIGREVGYTQGLEDGYQDGKLNGPR